MAEKKCSRCGEKKALDEFHKDAGRKDGLYPRCKECVKKYHDKNREKLSAVAAEWNSQHSERVAAIRRKYYASHRDEIGAHRKAYLAAHPGYEREKSMRRRARDGGETSRQYAARWAREYPDRDLARVHRRRARIKSIGGSFTGDEWKNICRVYGDKCLCCGSETDLTVDHIVPIALGGSNNIDNIQPLCKSCNSRKGARVIDYRPEAKK